MSACETRLQPDHRPDKEHHKTQQYKLGGHALSARPDLYLGLIAVKRVHAGCLNVNARFPQGKVLRLHRVMQARLCERMPRSG